MPKSGVTSTKLILESGLDQMRVNPSPEMCTFAATQKKMEEWQAQNIFTVFLAGSFDLLTRNHLLGLTHSRVLAAMAILNIGTICDEECLHAVHELAASDKIRLMVTMDSNQALAERKSHRSEAGNCQKPILDWETRAAMLVYQSIPGYPDTTRRIPLVNFITSHGPGSCGACPNGGCLTDNNSDMAVGLSPALLIVNSQSFNTVAEIRQFKRCGFLPNTKVIEIKESDEQYEDFLIGGPIKTTDIVRRIKQYAR